MKKRILAWLLCLAMVLALLPSAVLADDDTVEFQMIYYKVDVKNDVIVKINGEKATEYSKDDTSAGGEVQLIFKVKKDAVIDVLYTPADPSRMPAPSLFYESDPFVSVPDEYRVKDGVTVTRNQDGTYNIKVLMDKISFGKVSKDDSRYNWLFDVFAFDDGTSIDDISIVGAYLHISTEPAKAEPSDVKISGLGFKADKTAAAREIAALGGTAGSVKNNTMYFKLDGLDASKTYTAKITMVTDNIVAEGVYDDIPRDVHSESVSGAASKVVSFNIDDNWLVGGRYTVSVYEGAATGAAVSTKELILWDVGFDVINGTIKGISAGHLYDVLAMGTKNGVTENISSIAPEVTPDPGYRVGGWKKMNETFSTTYFTVYQMTCVEGSAPSLPETGTAHPNTVKVELDGRTVEFQMYMLKDANGGVTNYIKVRDLALAMDGTKAQFNVGWDQAAGKVNLETGKPYTTRNGKENNTPFSDDRIYELPANPTYVDGKASDFEAFVLKDDDGGQYTYYQLRDLGSKLGFNVSWTVERGVYIESDKPYVDERV